MKAIVQDGRVFAATDSPQEALEALIAEAVRDVCVRHRQTVREVLDRETQPGSVSGVRDMTRDTFGGIAWAQGRVVQIATRAGGNGAEAYLREAMTAAANLPTTAELATEQRRAAEALNNAKVTKYVAPESAE